MGRRGTTLFGSLMILAAMFGATAYSPTLYRLFCEVTGFGGATQRSAAAPGAASNRIVTVRFAADVHGDLPWRFGPAQREMRVVVGQQQLAFYIAENTANEGITGTAIFNVTPAKAGQYFNKIACFCFDEQHLTPRARAEMPVSFFIDPAMLNDRNMDDVTTVTLHYTFYRTLVPKKAERPAGASASQTD